jgi:hypothetical protein
MYKRQNNEQNEKYVMKTFMSLVLFVLDFIENFKFNYFFSSTNLTAFNDLLECNSQICISFYDFTESCVSIYD